MNADNLQLPIKTEALRRILKKYFLTSASVFGSYARGSVRMDSDLDLSVTYPPHTSLFKVIDLQSELESATGNRVDLVSKKYIKPRLAWSIEHDLAGIL